MPAPPTVRLGQMEKAIHRDRLTDRKPVSETDRTPPSLPETRTRESGETRSV